MPFHYTLPSGMIVILEEPFTEVPTSEEIFAMEVYAVAIKQVARADGSFNRRDAEQRMAEIIDGLAASTEGLP